MLFLRNRDDLQLPASRTLLTCFGRLQAHAAAYCIAEQPPGCCPTGSTQRNSCRMFHPKPGIVRLPTSSIACIAAALGCRGFAGPAMDPYLNLIRGPDSRPLRTHLLRPSRRQAFITAGTWRRVLALPSSSLHLGLVFTDYSWDYYVLTLVVPSNNRTE